MVFGGTKKQKKSRDFSSYAGNINKLINLKKIKTHVIFGKLKIFRLIFDQLYLLYHFQFMEERKKGRKEERKKGSYGEILFEKSITFDSFKIKFFR
ncbi:MAG: hypothetical protein LBF22_10455 [Deltaproteobacteria bacterium]|nr:hypothetical protein [Deltaproteobacteria bacterium]